MTPRTVLLSDQFLNRVTITGADDSIEPEDLIGIYNDFPFVEWGILLSSSSFPDGRPRFPSEDWLRRLYNVSTQEDRFFDIGGWMHVKKFPLSGHLCGKWVKDVMNGTWSFVKDTNRFIPNMFSRYQLNYHGTAHELTDTFCDAFSEPWFRGRQVIVQCDGVNDNVYDQLQANKIVSAKFFDISHGAGVVPEEWPEATKGDYCGYGGGLSPDNVEDQIEAIWERVPRGQLAWIDTETKVRSNDDEQFDLNKVWDFLKKCEPWIKGCT